MAKSNTDVEVKITIGKTPDGKRIRKSFYGKSKRAAKEKADKWLLENAQAIANDEFERPCPTFREVHEEFYRHKEKTIRKNSNTQLKTISRIALEKFADYKISAIKHNHITKFADDLSDKYAQSYIKGIVSQLSAIFNYAIHCEYVSKNPCTGVKFRSSKEKITKQVYTQEEADKVLEFCRSHPLGLAIDIMLSYGTTMSETLGIQYDDIDFEDKTIHISRGVTRSPGAVTVDKPKNKHRVRTIAVSEATLKHIESVHDKKYTYLIHESDPEQPYDPQRFRRQIFEKFMDDMYNTLSIKKLNPHELRHTRATLWVEQDINLFAIAEEMGWADLQMLKEVYGHPKIEKLRSMLKIDE